MNLLKGNASIRVVASDDNRVFYGVMGLFEDLVKEKLISDAPYISRDKWVFILYHNEDYLECGVYDTRDELVKCVEANFMKV